MEKKDRKYKNETKCRREVKREVKYEYGLKKPLNWEIIRKMPNENFIFAKVDQNYNVEYLSKKMIYPLSVKLKIFFKEVLRRLFFMSSRKFNIYDLLACPICKNNLLKKGSWLICNNCHRRYPTIEGVPILLKEKGILCEDLKI